MTGRRGLQRGKSAWAQRLASLVARCAVVALTCCVAAPALGQIPCKYEVKAIYQHPPCGFIPNSTSALGISPNGQYVCGSHSQCDFYAEANVYIVATGQLITIPRPTGVLGAIAVDVNDNGIVVGTADVTVPSGASRAFAWNLNTGVWTDIHPQNIGQGVSFGSAINSSNIICGTRSIDDGGSSIQPQTAFTYDLATGQFTDLGLIDGFGTSGADVNNAGAVTGKMGIGNETQPFLWQDGTVAPLGSLAGLETVPLGISGNGHVVGRSRLPAKGKGFGPNHAFLWSAGVMTDLGTLPGHESSVADEIQASGLVGGISRAFAGGPNTAFVWHAGLMRDLNDMIEAPADLVIRGVGGFSDSGILVANAYSRATYWQTFILTPNFVVGDTTSDCLVNVSDLLTVINEWGESRSPADVNQDGIVNQLDLIMVIENWTPF